MAALRLFFLAIFFLILNQASSDSSKRFIDSCFEQACNRWVAPSRVPTNDTSRCGKTPASPCMGMNNATWLPLKKNQPLVVCLLPGEHMPFEGPYVIEPGTKICGAEPDSVSISGGGIAWERPVFLLRSSSDLDGDTTQGLTEGFARILFEEFIIKDMKHVTYDIDLVHVAGVRTVTFQDIVFDTIVDINDYFIDCRNNATCIFSNVYFKQSEGGSVLITNNATASFVNCNVEGLRSTRNALKFEDAHSVVIASSTLKKNPHGAIYQEGGNLFIDSSTFDSNTVYKEDYDERGGGAAIRATNGYLRVTGCSFFDNVAVESDGGAIRADKMKLAAFSNNIFRGNKAERSCGAISVHSAYADRTNPYSGAGSIDFSTFLNNRAKSGYGGALCTMGIRVKGSYFKKNRASLSGGAIFAANVTFIEYSSFDYNFAKELGGAVYLAEVPSRTRPLIIDYCNFTANQAFDSGGAAFSEASLVVAHSFMQDNNATYGGAIGADGEILVLKVVNTSLIDNHATVSGGAAWLGGLVTTYSFENSSFVRNYCWRSGGAVHLFAPFTQNPTRFSNTFFFANLLLNDATDPDGTDVALNSSVAIFDNVTVLSVLITDWSESRSSTARANFTNSLFLADPREYLTMQGATVSILLVNCSYINETISEDGADDPHQKEKRTALRLINRHGHSPKPLMKRVAPFGEQLPVGDIVSIPFTDSSVIACSVGRFFSNSTTAGAHCQPCAQGQYNFDGTNNRCFDCPFRIGCVDIRSNIQYEVAKGYQPAPAQKPQRILKCKMHMSGLEGLKPVPHRDTNHDDHHESTSPVEAAPESSHNDHQKRSSLVLEDFDDELMEHGYHFLSPLPKLRSSTRHIVPRPQIKFSVFSSTPVSSDDDDEQHHQEEEHGDEQHGEDEDHSPCLPTTCRSVCKPTFGNLTISNCEVRCDELSCADGYEERLCAKCECLSIDHCWYRSHHSCHKCRPPERLWPSIVLLVVSLVVFTVFRRRLLKILFFCVTVTAITLVLTRTGDRFLVSWILIAFIVFLEKVKTSSEGVLKSFIFWIQTTLSLINSWVWPTPVRGALEYLQLVEFSGWGLECYLPQWFGSELGKFLFILCLPILLSTLLFVSVSGTTLLRKISFCKKLQTYDPLSFIPRLKWKSKRKAIRKKLLKKVFRRSANGGTDTESEDPYAPLLNPPALRPKPMLDDDHESEFDDGPMFSPPPMRHHSRAPTAGADAFSFSSFHSTAGADISAKRDSLLSSDETSLDQSMKDLSSFSHHTSGDPHDHGSVSIQSEWERNSAANPHAPKKTILLRNDHPWCSFLPFRLPLRDLNLCIRDPDTMHSHRGGRLLYGGLPLDQMYFISQLRR
eukprot:TRINITY_DN6614_c0_g1_i1.p1 TRINITY_DN6614_c0_g1~~TRINITY_DN6614_c0_g1_i1.p1  ORF type:complete len:1380 (+),score=223.93 TRINITY_DN6614_c0_g1_i1:85-4140(+)